MLSTEISARTISDTLSCKKPEAEGGKKIGKGALEKALKKARKSIRKVEIQCSTDRSF